MSAITSSSRLSATLENEADPTRRYGLVSSVVDIAHR